MACSRPPLLCGVLSAVNDNSPLTPLCADDPEEGNVQVVKSQVRKYLERAEEIKKAGPVSNGGRSVEGLLVLRAATRAAL